MAFFFQGLSGDEFHFDSNGDGPARYNILHFKEVKKGDFRWIRVGEYLDGELKLNVDGKFQTSADLLDVFRHTGIYLSFNVRIAVTYVPRTNSAMQNG